MSMKTSKSNWHSLRKHQQNQAEGRKSQASQKAKREFEKKGTKTEKQMNSEPNRDKNIGGFANVANSENTEFAFPSKNENFSPLFSSSLITTPQNSKINGAINLANPFFAFNEGFMGKNAAARAIQEAWRSRRKKQKTKEKISELQLIPMPISANKAMNQPPSIKESPKNHHGETKNQLNLRGRNTNALQSSSSLAKSWSSTSSSNNAYNANKDTEGTPVATRKQQRQAKKSNAKEIGSDLIQRTTLLMNNSSLYNKILQRKSSSGSRSNREKSEKDIKKIQKAFRRHLARRARKATIVQRWFRKKLQNKKMIGSIRKIKMKIEGLLVGYRTRMVMKTKKIQGLKQQILELLSYLRKINEGGCSTQEELEVVSLLKEQILMSQKQLSDYIGFFESDGRWVHHKLGNCLGVFKRGHLTVEELRKSFGPLPEIKENKEETSPTKPNSPRGSLSEKRNFWASNYGEVPEQKDKSLLLGNSRIQQFSSCEETEKTKNSEKNSLFSSANSQCFSSEPGSSDQQAGNSSKFNRKRQKPVLPKNRQKENGKSKGILSNLKKNTQSFNSKNYQVAFPGPKKNHLELFQNQKKEGNKFFGNEGNRTGSMQSEKGSWLLEQNQEKSGKLFEWKMEKFGKNTQNAPNITQNKVDQIGRGNGNLLKKKSTSFIEGKGGSGNSSLIQKNSELSKTKRTITSSPRFLKKLNLFKGLTAKPRPASSNVSSGPSGLTLVERILIQQNKVTRYSFIEAPSKPKENFQLNRYNRPYAKSFVTTQKRPNDKQPPLNLFSHVPKQKSGRPPLVPQIVPSTKKALLETKSKQSSFFSSIKKNPSSFVEQKPEVNNSNGSVQVETIISLKRNSFQSSKNSPRKSKSSKPDLVRLSFEEYEEAIRNARNIKETEGNSKEIPTMKSNSEFCEHLKRLKSLEEIEETLQMDSVRLRKWN